MNDNIIFKSQSTICKMKQWKKSGRKLFDEEIDIAKKGLDWGISTSIDTVYHTIFTEMIKNEYNKQIFKFRLVGKSIFRTSTTIQHKYRIGKSSKIKDL